MSVKEYFSEMSTQVFNCGKRNSFQNIGSLASPNFLLGIFPDTFTVKGLCLLYRFRGNEEPQAFNLLS